MIVIHETLSSDTDKVTKFVVSSEFFPEIGRNEVSVIWKDTKTVICMPSQTNCDRGCTFCHLTGTTRPVNNIPDMWYREVTYHLINMLFLHDSPILISFMGAGEPLYNTENIIKYASDMDDIFGLRYAIATTIPEEDLFQVFANKVNDNDLNMKVHLSLHGISSRNKIMLDNVPATRCIDLMNLYETHIGDIEYHYTLIDGVNDSWDDMKELRDHIIDNTFGIIKFISFNPVNDLNASTKFTKKDLIEFFGADRIEFYTPPGIDIGSSCGQFNKELYNI